MRCLKFVLTSILLILGLVVLIILMILNGEDA